MKPIVLTVSAVQDFQPVLASHVDPVTKEVTNTTGPTQWRISCGSANIAIVTNVKPDIKAGDHLLISKYEPAAPNEPWDHRKNNPL